MAVRLINAESLKVLDEAILSYFYIFTRRYWRRTRLSM